MNNFTPYHVDKDEVENFGGLEGGAEGGVSRFELAAPLAEVPDYYGQQCRSSKLHPPFFFLLTDTRGIQIGSCDHQNHFSSGQPETTKKCNSYPVHRVQLSVDNRDIQVKSNGRGHFFYSPVLATPPPPPALPGTHKPDLAGAFWQKA